jgi:hypothetical protein
MAFHQTPEHAPVLASKVGRSGHIARCPTEHFLDIVAFKGCDGAGARLAKIAARELLAWVEDCNREPRRVR